MRRIAPFLLALALLCGCTFDAPSPTSPAVVADCGYGGRVRAWLDQNADGRRDSGEPPLAGITFVLRVEEYSLEIRRVTDDRGEALLNRFIGGCPIAVAEVYVEIPSGYRATTPTQRMTIGDTSLEIGLVTVP